MFTIFGAHNTLTQEIMFLFAALAVFMLGIVALAVDVVRRNQRRREAENRPIDTSIFQQSTKESFASPELDGAEAKTMEDAAAEPAEIEEVVAEEAGAEEAGAEPAAREPAPEATEAMPDDEAPALPIEADAFAVLTVEAPAFEVHELEIYALEAHAFEEQPSDVAPVEEQGTEPAPVAAEDAAYEENAACDPEIIAHEQPLPAAPEPLPEAVALPADVAEADLRAPPAVQDEALIPEALIPEALVLEALVLEAMQAEETPEWAAEATFEAMPAAATEAVAAPGTADEVFAQEPATAWEQPAPEPVPVLICTRFGAGFGDKTVLSGVDFTVLDQGITTLMGPVGTGKSTLLRALAGMLHQSGLFKSWGDAWFNGAPLGADNRPLLVAQRIQLIRRSALDNLAFHLQTASLSPAALSDWAAQWLSQAGAAQIIPQLDRPFLELDQLSQRIVTILREAAAEPALLMIDEPTHGLPEADATVLLNLLQRLASFTPLLVVLQNHKHAMRISHQVILLAGGQVLASCDAGAFFNNPPNAMVAQFIATGACAVPAADAAMEPAAEAAMGPAADAASEAAADVTTPEATPEAAIEPPPEAEPPALTADSLAAIKDEIRNRLAAEIEPAPEMQFAGPELIELEPVNASEVVLNLSPAMPDFIEADTGDEITLSRHMVISAPLPPRAAAAQMASLAPATQQNSEQEAAIRYPAGTGPRGFVWIEDGRLAATPMPGIAGPADDDLELLKNTGVTVLITLTEQDFSQDVLARHGLRNLHFPIADRTAPTTGETDMLVNQMRDMLDNGEVLAVHCLAGLGRTGTILAAYMVKEKGVSAQVALNQIRRFNRQFVQTDDQEDFLMEYEVQQEQTVLRNRAAGGGNPA